ncbi:hypothetical protein CMO91_05380 [Candidatus Woesearchaeota archaeon]|nr:hypothetical protein [Candidatus Woesearchaeota archaeon]|tara:strand:- start:358 stop:753 length:396 start_codon:yes stop_codon:yes gene_type:complete
MTTIDVSSKVAPLNTGLIREELEGFLRKQDIEGSIRAVVTKGNARTRKLQGLECSLHMNSGRDNVHVHAQGFGERHMVKNAIKKVTTALRKKHAVHKRKSYAEALGALTQAAGESQPDEPDLLAEVLPPLR